MPQISVTINGKKYRMACEDGQEEHLTQLAHQFNNHILQMKKSFGDIGDQRLTIMAGIMVIDQLLELQKKLQEVSSDCAILCKARDDAVALHENNDTKFVKILNQASKKIELISTKLSQKDILS